MSDEMNDQIVGNYRLNTGLEASRKRGRLVIAKETFANKVRSILNSAPFNSILQLKKIKLVEMSEPKQTNTTQCWKVLLKIPNSTLLIYTMIEFSRRGIDSDILFEAINASLLREYMLPPSMSNHYSITNMLRFAFTRRGIYLSH